jgi:L-fucose/D-arabinose isomerase
MAQVSGQRLKGRVPKVGIRPVIDGRRQGVRESLENQTLGMARSAARLIEGTLRHASGLPVECVIPPTCIGGAAEAAATAELFEREGALVSLTVTPCWCYGTEVMDADPMSPKAIWGFNGTERPGAVYLAAALAGHSQRGLPAFGIYGHDVQDAGDTTLPDDVRERLLAFVKAGLALAEMRGKSYLSIGGVSMGIAGSAVDADFLQSSLGLRTETVDMVELVRRMEREIYDADEYKRARAWVTAKCPEGPDANPAAGQRSRAEKDRDWDTVVKMALGTRDLMVGNPRLAALGFGEEALGHNAILAGFQGQRQWTDHLPNGDFMEAILNSSFDWDGLRQPFLLATENDCLNGVAMLFGHLLTNTAQVFCDVRTYWSPDAVKRVTGKELGGPARGGVIHLLNSGAAALDGAGRQRTDGRPAIKPFWEISVAEVEATLKATVWCPAATEYFRGGGYSSHFVSEGGMPATMARVNLVKGLGPVLQIAEGQTVELPADVHQALNQRTNPTWPTTWFAPRLTGSGPFSDVYSVMANWGANHCALSYGHIGADLITLAALLRIPVALHNVEDARIFRPSYWGAFGAQDLQGADFRACAALGPLYGRRG